MSIVSRIMEKCARALVGVGIVVRTTVNSVLASDPTIGAGTAASVSTEPNGSFWMTTDGAPKFRIGSAWKDVALLGGATNDFAYTATSADELINVDLSMNHATAQGIALDAAAIQLTTARSSGILAAVGSATTSLAGDSGGTYADFWARTPTDGGGSAIHVALLVSAGHDRVIDYSAMLTGQAVFYCPANVAVASRWADSVGPILDLVTTTGGRAVNLFERLTTTDGVASGTAKVVGGRLDSNTAAGTALTASTSEAVLKSTTILANTLKAGSTLQVRWKTRVTADAGATTLTNRLRLGTTTLTGTAVVSTDAVDTASGDVQMGFVELICRAAPGAAVAIEGMGWYTDPGAAGGAFKSVSLDATNFATNGALLLELTGQWSASDANSVQMEHWSVEVV